MATALYRRYRPENFTEMIGQTHVTEPLMTALRSERVGHAYLFSGPRGCGKTTSARVLARCLNCATGPTDSPCGTCPSCVELSRDGGGSLDVVEIDAASHGGVDDARELRERAVFAPARDRFKIFIIDEAHMVTPAGFNALLKIVEEPPPHVKFIFATTEPEKVIGTIRSRTHHYPFRLIAPGALIDYAQSLCNSEGITVEPGVLPLVVRAGGGSVRDTLSILDQLIAGSEGTTVTIDRASGLLGFTSTELIDEVVHALSTADASAAFNAIDRVVQTGQDPRRFVEDLLERLRDLIVIGATSVDGAAAVFRGVPEAQLNRMFQQSLAFGRGEASRLADLVSAALDSMAGATAPRLQLELLIARALVGATPSEKTSVDPTLSTPRVSSSAASPTSSAAGAPTGFAAQLTAARESASQQQTEVTRAATTAPVTQAPGARPGDAAETAGAAAARAIEHTQASPAAPARAFDSGPLAADLPPAATSYAPGQSPSDYVNAMRTARDFLKNDDAGAHQKPVAAPGAAEPTAPSQVSEPDRFATAPEHTREQSAMTSEGPVDTVQQPAPHATAEPASAPFSDLQSAQAAVEEARVHVESLTTAVSAVPVTLADLREVWSEILEELHETDEPAWAAISRVQPLELIEETLTVGLTSGEDLNRFKADGAGPLREAIDAALGIQVKYLPRRLPSAQQHAGDPGPVPSAAARREHATDPAEDPDPARVQSAESVATPPPVAPASSSTASGSPDPLERRLGAVLGRISTREPVTPQPQQPVQQHVPPAAPPQQPTVVSRIQSTPTAAPARTAPDSAVDTEYPEPPEDPYAFAAPIVPEPGVSKTSYGSASMPDPNPNPKPEPAPKPAANREAEPLEKSASAPPIAANHTATEVRSPSQLADSAPAAAAVETRTAPTPTFVRYGESVVREVLGARFVEERPLATATDPQ